MVTTKDTKDTKVEFLWPSFVPFVAHPSNALMAKR
jgi:hypothetical protein